MTFNRQDHIWERAFDVEVRHGDAAEQEARRRIGRYADRCEYEDAALWASVADRLRKLHEIGKPV